VFEGVEYQNCSNLVIHLKPKNVRMNFNVKYLMVNSLVHS